MRFLLLLFIPLFAACGSPQDGPLADSVSEDHYDASREDVNSSCCFTTEEQFLPFFPQFSDSSGFTVDRGARDVQITCPYDTLQQSHCTRGYFNADSQLVSVKIIDYCAASDGTVDSAYVGKLRAYRSDKNVNEFNEFEAAGTYHGFACYLPLNKFALLTVVVDERFIVEISHYRAINSRSVISLMEQMPLGKLAAFGK